jgi:hypothetical protein
VQGISIIKGELSDAASLHRALKGVTIVLSFLGAYPSVRTFATRDTSTPIADSFDVILEAMRKKNTKRIMALGTPSYRVKGEMVRKVFAEHERV